MSAEDPPAPSERAPWPPTALAVKSPSALGVAAALLAAYAAWRFSVFVAARVADPVGSAFFAPAPGAAPSIADHVLWAAGSAWAPLADLLAPAAAVAATYAAFAGTRAAARPILAAIAALAVGLVGGAAAFAAPGLTEVASWGALVACAAVFWAISALRGAGALWITGAVCLVAATLGSLIAFAARIEHVYQDAYDAAQAASSGVRGALVLTALALAAAALTRWRPQLRRSLRIVAYGVGAAAAALVVASLAPAASPHLRPYGDRAAAGPAVAALAGVGASCVGAVTAALLSAAISALVPGRAARPPRD